MYHCAENMFIKLTVLVTPIKLHVKMFLIKLSNDIIQLNLVNRKPQDYNVAIKYIKTFMLL